MDMLVVVIVLVVVALLTALVTRHNPRLGIIVHPEPKAPITDGTTDDVVVDDALRDRRESEWRHWYQLGSS